MQRIATNGGVGRRHGRWAWDPAVPSVLTFACALSIHPWAGAPLSRPISLELREANLFAIAMLAGVVWVLAALGRRFWCGDHKVSAATCAVCVSLVLVIAATVPHSAVHVSAYFGLILVSTAMFLVWALDSLDLGQVLPPFAPIAFGPQFYMSHGFGGLQLLLIGSLLVASNLTFRHVGTRGFV